MCQGIIDIGLNEQGIKQAEIICNNIVTDNKLMKEEMKIYKKK